MSKNKKIVLAALILALAVAVCGALWCMFAPTGTEGGKEISVTIVHGDASEAVYTIATDAEFLREALESQDLIAGDESEYGLYVKTVDGETIDEANMEWWCFTAGGEWVMTGVDTTPIADGDCYEITFTVGY